MKINVTPDIRALLDQRFGPAIEPKWRPLAAVAGRDYRHEVEDPQAVALHKERSVVRWATWQMFFMLYLQKIGIGTTTTKVGLPLLLVVFSTAYMVLQRRVSFSPVRLGFFCLFLSLSLLSQVLAQRSVSPTSVGELYVIYVFGALSAPLPEDAYFKVLRRYTWLMVPPALIGMTQYGIQLINGGGDPIGMDKIVPHSWLVQGFFYDAHYPTWRDAFQRPNGFVFLEPSFFSFFLAGAAIIEVTYFRRLWMAALLVVATALSTGATGMTMFVVTFPILLIRESPRVMMTLLVFGVVGLVIALAAGVELPLVSRLQELDTGGTVSGLSSGSVRLIVPFNALIKLLSDPEFLISGMGAGTITLDFGSAWPMLKLTYEYGIATMLSFMLYLLICVCKSNYNIPFLIAVMVVYNFTGGYLHDDVSDMFFLLLLTVIVPPRKKPDEVLRLSRHRTGPVGLTRTLPTPRFIER